jgi:DNA-binding CsgD family transcriptional regulator
LLLDPTLKLIFANEEVFQILDYQSGKAKQRRNGFLDEFLQDKVYPMLRVEGSAEGSSGQVRSVIEFQSGRRRYLCRIFRVAPKLKFGNRQYDVALLFERAPSPTFDIDKIQKTYHLTQREEEVLQHLIRGLTTKEIASRMQVSPNTVKVFLRLLMIKMGFRTRSAVISKVMECRS